LSEDHVECGACAQIKHDVFLSWTRVNGAKSVIAVSDVDESDWFNDQHVVMT